MSVFSVVCCVSSLRRHYHSTREVLVSVVCLSVILKPRMRRSWPRRGCYVTEKNELENSLCEGTDF